jgi:hypothetical protein
MSAQRIQHVLFGFCAGVFDSSGGGRIQRPERGDKIRLDGSEYYAKLVLPKRQSD